MEIIYRKLSELKPNPKNPRQSTKDAVEKLAESIKANPKFFEARPILLSDRTGELVIIGGERRSEAAALLGMKTVPTILIPGLTEAKEDEILIKDNTHAGVWDEQKLAMWGKEQLQGWNVEGVKWPKQEQAIKEDDFNPDKQVEKRCNPGDIWQLGKHRLMCGDSTDAGQVALLMNGETADLLLTDPPYGTTALEWDVKIDLQKVFKSIKDACKKDAVVLITGAQPFVTDIINAGRDLFRYEIIWKKTQSSGFLQANNAPLRIHENIIVFGKSSGTYNPIKKKIGERTGRVRHQKANRAKHYHGNNESIYIDDGTRYPTDVVEFSNWNGALFGDTSKEVVHPTQKPVELFSYLIQTYTDEENKVLDLFGGSGTTLIAAEQLNRKCYMMELDPHYCDVILTRWEQFTGKKAKKITG